LNRMNNEICISEVKKRKRKRSREIKGVCLNLSWNEEVTEEAIVTSHKALLFANVCKNVPYPVIYFGYTVCMVGVKR